VGVREVRGAKNRAKEEFVMKKGIALVVAVAWLLGGSLAWAQKDEAKEHAELAKALGAAKVSLQTGLSASGSAGTPISAKYEVEDGKLQLSVYTKKGTGFSEVIVDHTTGKVTKTEAITSGDDLTAAKAQGEAMAKAKRSLRTVADQAAKANKGYRVVSVMPALKDGHPVAEVTLVKGEEFKAVSEKLD
jgi:hypothetical protein